MRHIDLNVHLSQIFAAADGQKVKASLDRAQRKAVSKPATRDAQYVRRNGPKKWSPLKKHLTSLLGKKCWYTEVEPTGAPLAIDHYRPFCEYWWLAYDAENYRVACPWANSREHNESHGRAGGKGDDFPLLQPEQRAADKQGLGNESPVILDPCSAGDCGLLAFQADGRPVLNPGRNGDAIAKRRVDQSLILLNLDHPDFNAKREKLCNDIADDVRIHEDLPPQSAERATLRNRLKERLLPKASFSTAARSYLQFHRHLNWVQDILDSV
jgi:hypothetical protein